MPSSYRWVILALAVTGFFQTHLHRMGFAPLIPTFTTDLGLTYAAAGTIQTAYFWTYTIAQIPVGVVVDRWGTRRVMITCMALLAAGALAFARSESYAGAIASRMLVGLGAAAVWVPGMRLVMEWFPPAERGRATGMMSGGGAVGGTIGLVLVPWLATRWGWRAAYAATAVPALLTLGLIALLMRTSAPASGVASGGRGALGRVVRTPSIWPVNITVLFAYGSYFSFVTFLPSFLVVRLGLSQAEAGLVTSLITAGTIVSWPLAGLLSDRLGRRKPIYLLSQVMSIAVCLGFAFVVPHLGLRGAMLTALASGLLVGGMILPFVMIVEMFPPELAGTAVGVTNAACFVGGMIFPIVLGYVADVTGGFVASFVLAAVLQALSSACALAVAETGHRRPLPA